MGYYIFQNGHIKPSSGFYYRDWLNGEGKEYFLPSIEIEKDGFKYSLDTMFNGIIDEGEGLYPFILLYFKDELQIKGDKIKREHVDNDVEYFDNFNNLKKRRDEIISLFNQGIFPAFKPL